MAKATYIGVGNVARKVKQPYIGVENVARKVKSGYIGVDNVARQFFSGGTPVGSLEVGSSVWMNVDGVATEFLVVHQGIPDATLYDSSCDGTWLLMNNIYVERAWGNGTTLNDYENSSIHTYLNDTFLSLLDADIQNKVKVVKIPYYKGKGLSGSSLQGTNGLSTQVFLLSYSEVGFGSNGNGSALDYFNGVDNSVRIDGSSYAYGWFLRTPVTSGNAFVYMVYNGGNSQSPVGDARGIRPALILPSDALIDENFNVIGN